MALARLDQILSRYGYCSRSEAAGWVRDGRVTIGDAPAKARDQKVDVETVRVDHKPIENPRGILALLHKPAGYVCSHDEREGATIYDLLPAQWLRRNPPVTTIGRLDKDTTGVLLITDVGPLVQRWTSPKHKVPKIYEVRVDHNLEPALIDLFSAGTLQLKEEDKPCKPARLEIVDARHARLELTEGLYHQVKRMFASQGWTVTQLHRSRFGELELGNLKSGEWQLLPLPHEK